MKLKTLLLASFALVSSSAWGQVQNFPTVLSADASGAMASLPANANFYRCTNADIDGNLDPDLIYLTQYGLLICMNPIISGACFFVPNPATNLSIGDVLPMPGPTGQNKLVLAGLNGLTAIMFDFSAGNGSVNWSSQLLGDQAVRGLIAIEGVPSYGSNPASIIGIAADGRTLVSIGTDANAPSGLILNSSVLGQTTGNARDLRSVDFNKDGSYEIAVLGDQGLELFDDEGTWIITHPASGVVGTLARVNSATSEQIAWVRAAATGGSELVIADDASVQAPVDLGGYTSHSLSAADFDQDGDADLALVLRDVSEVLLISNQGGVFDFSLPQILVTGNAPSLDNPASIQTLDMDMDGYIDVICADRQTREIISFVNKGASNNVLVSPPVNYINITGRNTFDWDMEPYSRDVITAQATHCEIWTSIQTAGPEGEWGNPSQIGAPWNTVVVPVSALFVSLSFAPAGVDPDNSLCYVTGRYIRIENGVVVYRWPPTKTVLYNPGNNDLDNFLATAYGPNSVALTTLQVGNGEKVGIGHLPPPPPFPPLPPIPTGGV